MKVQAEVARAEYFGGKNYVINAIQKQQCLHSENVCLPNKPMALASTPNEYLGSENTKGQDQV